jgi:transcriptional regulator with PAS, ATPase and Fis domain
LGRFELANGGTILLDEVGEMPPATQVKLLRVLEDRSFFRVGGAQPIHVDVRVISATNKSLKEAVALSTFRDDLFYRLNVLSVYLPPLRERRSDIPLLVRTFITEFAKTHDRNFRGITPDAIQILVDADWPGNVRQLKNLIESMVVLAPEGEIRASDIPRDIRERTRTLPVRIAAPPPPPPSSPSREVTGQELEFIFRTLVELKMQLEDLRGRIQERPAERVEVIEVGGGSREQGAGGGSRVITASVDPLDATLEPDQPVIYKPGMSMSDVERAAIDAALRETRGNRRKAAETLGIGERTLYRKLKEYAID